MEQDMEGLEDNTIKQTNSCYNKSKKKKVIIIVIAILCVAAVIGFVITKVVTTPKVEIDYGTSDIYTQKDMDEAIKVIKRKIRHMKGFELHKVYYAGDKSSNSDSVLKWINELAKEMAGQMILLRLYISKVIFIRQRKRKMWRIPVLM